LFLLLVHNSTKYHLKAIYVNEDGGAVRTNLELKTRPRVDVLTLSENLLVLRNSLDFVRSILKNPLAMECALTLWVDVLRQWAVWSNLELLELENAYVIENTNTADDLSMYWW